MKALLEAGADHPAQDMFGRTEIYHVTIGRRKDDVARAGKPLIDVGRTQQHLEAPRTPGSICMRTPKTASAEAFQILLTQIGNKSCQQ